MVVKLELDENDSSYWVAKGVDGKIKRHKGQFEVYIKGELKGTTMAFAPAYDILNQEVGNELG